MGLAIGGNTMAEVKRISPKVTQPAGEKAIQINRLKETAEPTESAAWAGNSAVTIATILNGGKYESEFGPLLGGAEAPGTQYLGLPNYPISADQTTPKQFDYVEGLVTEILAPLEYPQSEME
jgi:hypothetical protein